MCRMGWRKKCARTEIDRRDGITISDTKVRKQFHKRRLVFGRCGFVVPAVGGAVGQRIHRPAAALCC